MKFKLPVIAAVLLLCMTSPLTSSAEASGNWLFCGYRIAKKHEPWIRAYGRTDKWNHCTMTCVITLRCNAGDAHQIGVLKELADLFGPGVADFEDLKANDRGIELAQHLQRKYARPDSSECYRECMRIYR